MGNQPQAKYRAGAVVLTVWENTRTINDKEVTNTSYNLVRVYKDKEGEWKNTNTFNEKDLADIQLVVEKARTERIK